MYKSAAVICTKNRAADLRRCLDSFAELPYVPELVLIIDASETNETELAVRDHQLCGRSGSRVQYATAIRPGLTKQRNQALMHLDGEVRVVHFLDDDVEVLDNYFLDIESSLDADPGLVGAGGTVLGGDRTAPGRLALMLGIDTPVAGRVLKTGFNVGAFEHPVDVDVEWLPGCSMSFRSESIQGLLFDESRAGYAIGEDVDFGLQASARGRLLHVARAKLVHHQSPVNRHKAAMLARMSVLHRWQLAIDKRGRVTKLAVVAGTLGRAVLWLAQSLKHREKAPLDCAIQSVMGIIDITRSVISHGR